MFYQEFRVTYLYNFLVVNSHIKTISTYFVAQKNYLKKIDNE